MEKISGNPPPGFERFGGGRFASELSGSLDKPHQSGRAVTKFHPAAPLEKGQCLGYPRSGFPYYAHIVQSDQLSYTATVRSDSGEWYGTMIITDIALPGGGNVPINDFLGLKFKIPVPALDNPTTIMVEPYAQLGVHMSYELIEDEPGVALVTAEIKWPEPHTISSSEKLLIGINGNLISDPDYWTSSISLYADKFPSGELRVRVPAAPQERLKDFKQVLHLKNGTMNVIVEAPLGADTTFEIPFGRYEVEALELKTEDETVVATAQASPENVEIELGSTAGIVLSEYSVAFYSAIDLHIGSLPPPLDAVALQVIVVAGGQTHRIDAFHDSTIPLRRLPASGRAEVSVEAIVNNIQYTSSKTIDLANDLFHIPFQYNDFAQTKVPDKDLALLAVNIVVDVASDRNILVRLTSRNGGVVYVESVPARAGTQYYPLGVLPGPYDVEATGFIFQGTVFAAKPDPSITIDYYELNVLELEMQEGASLTVHGFPSFLSFGAISDLYDLDGKGTTDFVNARTSCIFKYSGFDGMGDSNQYLEKETAVVTTIGLAAEVEARLKREYPNEPAEANAVLPLMVSYTVNLSLGDTPGKLKDKEGLACSFANYILALLTANREGKKSCPAGFIVNADFLGELQKDGYAPSYVMPGRDALEIAVNQWNDHWQDYYNWPEQPDVPLPEEFPEQLTNTIGGYVFAVNWITHRVAPKVTFGWQVNVWGVGRSDWVYSDDPGMSPAIVAQKTADFIDTLGAYKGEFKPNFVAVDRYEADDFTTRAYVNQYCYGPHEWRRYYEFLSELSLAMKEPLMPWQIPASRIAVKTEDVYSLEVQHFGTGGSWIFGQPEVGSHIDNIHPEVLRIVPVKVGVENVEELFKRGQPFDFTYPQYGDFPLRGIFCVNLGGGATTGFISSVGTTGPWTQEQSRKYREKSLYFEDFGSQKTSHIKHWSSWRSSGFKNATLKDNRFKGRTFERGKFSHETSKGGKSHQGRFDGGKFTDGKAKNSSTFAHGRSTDDKAKGTTFTYDRSIDNKAKGSAFTHGGSTDDKAKSSSTFTEGRFTLNKAKGSSTFAGGRFTDKSGSFTHGSSTDNKAKDSSWRSSAFGDSKFKSSTSGANTCTCMCSGCRDHHEKQRH